MDLSVSTEAFTQDDQSWLASAHGTDTAKPVTLDVSAFTKADHYPQGYIRSGTVIGPVGDAGKYGPSSGAGSAAGILLDAVKVPSSTSTPVQGALLWHGAVHAAKLTGDAADLPTAITAL